MDEAENLFYVNLVSEFILIITTVSFRIILVSIAPVLSLARHHHALPAAGPAPIPPQRRQGYSLHHLNTKLGNTRNIS
jgi:hypothetical protein